MKKNFDGINTAIEGTPVIEEDWTVDQLGNWFGIVQKGAGSTTLVLTTR